MVKRLPDKVEGIMLKDGQVKLKPGYKFVKRTNGTVTVARISGSVGLSNNVGGAWNCVCNDFKSSCGVIADPGGLICTNGTCKGNCTLTITVEGAKTNIIMY
jgi:hypothetical protein